MKYCSKLIVSLFLLFTITFTGVAKSATAMTFDQPKSHIACIVWCEEHHDTNYDNGNEDVWAFIAGVFAGIVTVFTLLDGFSHSSVVE
jgi:hypothetical protein